MLLIAIQWPACRIRQSHKQTIIHKLKMDFDTSASTWMPSPP